MSGTVVAELAGRLSLDTRQFIASLQKARKEQDGFRRQYEKPMRSGLPADPTKQTRQSFAKGAVAAERFGSAATRYVTLPLLGIGAASVKVATDFETSMARIDGLVGGFTKGELAAMSDGIRGLADDVHKGPNELADALYFVTSAGFSASESMEVVEVSAKAATAGLGDTAVIADAVSSILNAYGHEAISAAEATDEMVAAIAVGKLEAGELAPVLGRIVPIASTMGIEFDEVAGLLAVMSKSGLDAAEATTALRGIMTQLLSPSKMAKDLLADLSTSFGGASTSIEEVLLAAGDQGLLPVLRELYSATGQNTQAMSVLFPEVRGLAGALNVLTQDAAGVDAAMGQVSGSAGMMERAFGIASETGAVKFKDALVDLENAGIDLGASLLPMVESVARALGSIADAFGSLPGPARDAITTMLAIGIVVGPILKVIGKVGALRASWRDMSSEQAAATRSMTKTGLAVGGVITALVALSTAADSVGQEAVNVERLGDSIKSLADNKIEGVLAEKFGDDMKDLGHAVKTLDEISGKAEKFLKVGGLIPDVFGEGTTEWNRWQNAISATDQALADLARSGDVDTAVAAFDVMAAKVEAAGVPLDALLDLMPELRGYVSDAAAGVIDFGDASVETRRKVLELAKAMLIAQAGDTFWDRVAASAGPAMQEIDRQLGLLETSGGKAEKAVGGAMAPDVITGGEDTPAADAVYKIERAIKDADDAAKRFQDTFEYAFGGSISVTRAEIDVRAAGQALVETLTEIDEETGRRVATSDDVVSAALDQVDAFERLREAAGLSNEEFATLTAGMLTTMRQSGATEQEILSVVDALLGLGGIEDVEPYIKPDGTVDVQAAIDDVMAKLDEADEATATVVLDADDSPFLTAFQRVQQALRNLESATVSVTGRFNDDMYRASGGPVEAGGSYIVGERGPELFVPQTGGRVIEAAQTARMLDATISDHASEYARAGAKDGRAYAQAYTRAAQQASSSGGGRKETQDERNRRLWFAEVARQDREKATGFAGALGTVVEGGGAGQVRALRKAGSGSQQDFLGGLLGAVQQQADYEQALSELSAGGRKQFVELARRAGLNSNEINSLLSQIPESNVASGQVGRNGGAKGSGGGGDTYNVTVQAGIVGGNGKTVGEWIATELARNVRRGGH